MPMVLNLTPLQNIDNPTVIRAVAKDLDFLGVVLNEHLTSKRLHEFVEADKYYRNANVKIKEKTRYIMVDGRKEILTNLSNTQVAHAFMKKLVNQKASYLLGKPFSVDSAQEGLAKELDDLFSKAFFRKLLKVGKDAIKYGIGWVQIYYDENGELHLKRISPIEVIPFWKDADHTDLEALMRTYVIDVYHEDGTKTQVRKVEYYDKTGVYYFQVDKDNKLVVDADRRVFSGHFSLKKTREVVDEQNNKKVEEYEEEQSWVKIPFIAFKANDEELGILTFIKDLIDDYDKNVSDISDQLQDIPNALKVIKGYSGESKEEFAHNINVYRTVFIESDGDVSTIQTSIDIQAIDSHLNRLRQDIYDFGGGVDSQKETQNIASGVALKFKYADLDLDAKFMATEFSASMESLLWFICSDLKARGKGEYNPEEVNIVWNMDMAIAENEVIDNIIKSMPILSKETLIAQHPWVEDVNIEMEKMKRQEEQEQNEFGNIDEGASSNSPDNNEEEEE